MADYEQDEEFRRQLYLSAQLLSQNRPGEAVDLLRELAQKAPTSLDVAINLGGGYILQRKWSRAVRVLRQALEHHPDNAMLWANLGAAELGQMELSGPRQQERAIAAYERALQADPAAPNVHYHLGLIYKHRGELNRASAFFQRALEVQPQDRDAAYWLGKMRDLAEEQARQGSEQNAPGGGEHGTGEHGTGEHGTGQHSNGLHANGGAPQKPRPQADDPAE